MLQRVEKTVQLIQQDKLKKKKQSVNDENQPCIGPWNNISTDNNNNNNINRQ